MSEVIYTSYWGNLRAIREDGRFLPVQISRGFPKYMKREDIPKALHLAPEWSWMKEEKHLYDAHFQRLLDALNPEVVWLEMQQHAKNAGKLAPVLMCFEKPPFTEENWCHRRIVAEWLEKSLNVTVPELNLNNV